MSFELDRFSSTRLFSIPPLLYSTEVGWMGNVRRDEDPRLTGEDGELLNFNFYVSVVLMVGAEW